jgi:type I restriction enzyme S subunit
MASNKLQPYPDYKDSGVSRLGEIPAHWTVKRLRASITDCVNGIWGTDPNGKDDIVCVRVADFDRERHRVHLRKPTLRAVMPTERRRRLLQKGDLLLEKSGGGDLQPVGVVMLYDLDLPAVCSNFIARMPVNAEFDPAYLAYLHAYLYAIRVNVWSIKQTIGIQNLDAQAYLAELAAFPPKFEQFTIVRYLDHVNQRIDRYIRAKRKLIARLNEQKQVMINHFVTQGIEDSPRQPIVTPHGRIPWLDSVPKHWQVQSSRRLFSARKELAQPGDVQLAATQAYGVIPQEEFEQRVGRRVVKIFMHLEKRRHVEKDDFVISMRSFEGGLERAWTVVTPRSWTLKSRSLRDN